MNMPTFNADASLYKTEGQYFTGGTVAAQGGGAAVLPQACACTPCVTVGGGRRCFTIPVINKRVCVNIPSFGRWKVCGCVKFGWPPFSYKLQRC
jgi:hypothetical protein